MSDLSEQRYLQLAHAELAALVAALDEHPDEVFAELAGDVLTLELAGGTRYIVNTQRPARQIWLAAERSAWHFDYDSERVRWVDAKSGGELWSTLEQVLSAKVQRAVQLRR